MLIMNIRLCFMLVDVCRPLVRGLEAVEEAETKFSKKNQINGIPRTCGATPSMAVFAE